VGSIVSQEDDHEKYRYISLYRMQAEELFNNKE
jgi:hypothetical protein